MDRSLLFDKKVFFILSFFLLNIYFLFLKSELYESKTALIVRDLSANPTTSSLGLSLLGMGNSSQLQDSKIVEEYLNSLDVYKLLDEKFELTKHYKSQSLDIIERLSENVTVEEVMEFYQSRLNIVYDEVSGILHISFLHVDAEVSQNILSFLVAEVEKQVNEFNRRKAKKQLVFVEGEYLKSKEKMEQSSKTLEEYQNKHLIIDPQAEAMASSGMIVELESVLTQKKIEHATKKSYLHDSSIELITLKNEIKEIKESIRRKKQLLSGTSEERLNKSVFEYEKLKLQLEFDIEVYKNALIQLETTKLDVQKEAKTLSVLSRPNLPDGYTYPNKPKVFLTIFIVMFLFYGIFTMLLTIIKDHKE